MRHAIAVDFDGCLCQDRWPEIGEPNWPAIAALLELQKRGVALILNTCREGELLEKAILWCEYRGLSFDAVNENLPERIEAYGGDCRKISANEYWDDRAVRVRFDDYPYGKTYKKVFVGDLPKKLKEAAL
ncbi:MAG: hypothetical protein ACOYI6_04335 [Christensenellales bacterium]|jgi:hypothetical protein